MSLYPIILKKSLMKNEKRLSDCSDMRSNHYWFKGGIHRNDHYGKKRVIKVRC